MSAQGSQPPHRSGVGMIPGLDSAPLPQPLPQQVPPPGSAERWPWLQHLRRQPPFALEPWLEAIESERLQLQLDLLVALAPRLDDAATERLLAWWFASTEVDTALLEPLSQRRTAGSARLLRQALERQPSPEQQELVLPLLGHQRQPADFPLLAGHALDPQPAAVRRAALEGLCRGLSAWPAPALRRILAQLAEDLDPRLAAAAVDTLARVPAARPALLALRRRPLAAPVAQRLERRLKALRAAPLLLVVHGRAGGTIPSALLELAQELERRRGAPVRLQALTAASLPDPAALASGPGQPPLTLVPLFLLPGGHVRHDLPAIAAHWRRQGPLRRLPFLGAWPAWQRALAAEVAALAPAPVRLLHHPLEGPLPGRFLAHLERISGARVQAAPYSSDQLDSLMQSLAGPAIPLALAANRLTDTLKDRLGPPLLARERCYAVLLTHLEALP